MVDGYSAEGKVVSESPLGENDSIGSPSARSLWPLFLPPPPAAPLPSGFFVKDRNLVRLSFIELVI